MCSRRKFSNSPSSMLLLDASVHSLPRITAGRWETRMFFSLMYWKATEQNRVYLDDAFFAPSIPNLILFLSGCAA